MNEHLISVIIPVYNTAEYLPRCLDSILNNTYRELEVICVNDGSRDNSLEVLNSYAAKDPRVKVIDQENAGVSAARNRGLDKATGEYIAFVDSDDWVHRQYFEALLKTMHDHNADISICDTPEVFEMTADSQIDIRNLQSQLLMDVPYFHKSLGVWGRIYRRRVIGTHRFHSDIRLSEDTLFNLHIFEQRHYALRQAYCDCPLYYYFMREGSAIHSLPPCELAPLARWYLDHIDENTPDMVRNYFLIEAMKNLFTWRYSVMFSHESEDHVQIGQLISFGKSCLIKNRSISLHKRLLYWIMAQFPVTYRLFRILHDPTMLGWEKQQRQKAREAKQQ